MTQFADKSSNLCMKCLRETSVKRHAFAYLALIYALFFCDLMHIGSSLEFLCKHKMIFTHALITVDTVQWERKFSDKKINYGKN